MVEKTLKMLVSQESKSAVLENGWVQFELKSILDEMGLSLGMKLENFPGTRQSEKEGKAGKEEELNP